MGRLSTTECTYLPTFSWSKVLLELDHKVLCSMWSAPTSFVPKSSGTS